MDGHVGFADIEEVSASSSRSSTKSAAHRSPCEPNVRSDQQKGGRKPDQVVELFYQDRQMLPESFLD